MLVIKKLQNQCMEGEMLLKISLGVASRFFRYWTGSVQGM